MRNHQTIGLIASALLHTFLATHCTASETFAYQGGAGVQTWEQPANWSGGSGLFSQYPGDAPAAGTLDSVDFSGSAVVDLIDLQVNSPGLTIDAVTLGLGNVIFRGVGGGTFTTQSIQATPGRTNIVGLLGTFVMPNVELEIGQGISAIFQDTLLNSAPDGSIRTINNNSQSTMRVESQVILSDDADTAGHLRFLNGGLPATTIITGVISDGAAPGGRVNLSRGDFHLIAANTHSGVTQIGENHPQTETTAIIYTDLAFGTSRVDISGGQALKTIRGATGQGTRTLANDIRISRSAEFAGTESFVLNGLVYQSNGRELINNLSPGKLLTINGNIYASDTVDVRDWIFEGFGNTIVNSVIDDALGLPAVTGASMIKRDSGRLAFTNPDVAAYGGQTTVSGGVLQLGNGGAAVGLNGNLVSGSSTGTLELNHSESLIFDSPIGGELSVLHVGTGATTLSADSSGTGTIQVTAGKLIVDSDIGAGTVTVLQNATIGGSGVIAGSLQASGIVAPGNSSGVLSVGAASFGSGAKLVAEIGGLMVGTKYDQLLVATSASLAGELVVDLTEGFVPASTDTFTILSAATLSGNFANIPNGARLDTLGGEGAFLVSYDNILKSVVLSEFVPASTPLLAGDYNGDGFVDAADYTVWRDNLGGTELENETESLGIVDQADYNAWKANFGNTAEIGGGANAAVPEPGSIVLLLSIVGMQAAGWRRTRCA